MRSTVYYILFANWFAILPVVSTLFGSAKQLESVKQEKLVMLWIQFFENKKKETHLDQVKLDYSLNLQSSITKPHFTVT